MRMTHIEQIRFMNHESTIDFEMQWPFDGGSSRRRSEPFLEFSMQCFRIKDEVRYASLAGNSMKNVRFTPDFFDDFTQCFRTHLPVQ